MMHSQKSSEIITNLKFGNLKMLLDESTFSYSKEFYYRKLLLSDFLMRFLWKLTTD